MLLDRHVLTNLVPVSRKVKQMSKEAPEQLPDAIGRWGKTVVLHFASGNDAMNFFRSYCEALGFQADEGKYPPVPSLDFAREGTT